MENAKTGIPELTGDRRLPNINNESRVTAKAAVTIDVACVTPANAGVCSRIRFVWRQMRLSRRREQDRLRHEISQVLGLMALLMKSRNGQMDHDRTPGAARTLTPAFADRFLSRHRGVSGNHDYAAAARLVARPAPAPAVATGR